MKDALDTPAHRPRTANPRAVSVRLEARTMSKAKGTWRHDFRRGKIPDYVDQSRTQFNRTLMPMRPLYRIRDENAELRGKAGRQRAMKKNAAVIIAGIITFGHEAAQMFETRSPDQQDAAFRDLALAIAAELDTALESLVVHLDESTIHAHFTIRSYTNEGRAVSEASKRGTMTGIQDLAARVMQRYHPGIERGHRRWDRIAAGAEYAETVHRSVRELHRDLPAELEALRQQRVEVKRELAAISGKKAVEQAVLDALLVEGEQIDAELDAAGEELQVRTAELARLKEDEKAHQSELDALKASAAKTRRHLADLDARAVEEEKKEKRRLTYMVRLEKKEAEIAEKAADLARRTAATAAAEAVVAESHRLLEVRAAEMAQQRRCLVEAREKARLEAARVAVRMEEVSMREEKVAVARSKLETEAEEVRAQKGELDASLAAIDHMVAAVEAGKIRVLEDGKITLDDPAPLCAAPKPLRARLMPSIFRLVRKIDETEKRASLVEAMMKRVRQFLRRPDLPGEIECEARDIETDWEP